MSVAPFVSAVLLLMSPAVQTTETRALVATAQQRIESTDSRATGRLVRVDANGNRIADTFTLKAHWFPGVLRVLLEVAPSHGSAADANQEAQIKVLFEMRPNGPDTVRLFRPGASTPVSLPPSKWNEGVAGSDFSYEDFLQSEVFWPGQTLLKTARLGTHDCDVLDSTPGAPDHSQYSDVQTWFDHTTGYPLYTEKTMKDGAAKKDFTSLGLTQSGGVWVARQVEVKIQGRPGSTLLLFERGSTRAHLTPKDFSSERISRFNDSP